jgi:hypothetical protein
MGFTLTLWDLSLWIAVTAIILLVTSELLASYSDYLGEFVIDKTRLRVAAFVLGIAFVVTVVLHAIMG